MNDFVVSCGSSIESRRCTSLAVPSVAATSACVCPRVNSAEPWARGSTLVSIVIGRTSFGLRPSTRMPGVEHLRAQLVVLDVAEEAVDVLGVVGEIGEQLLGDLLLHLLDGLDAACAFPSG